MAKDKVFKAVIPAAGLGTRFLPVTKASPKEMLPLVDKPLIQYVVEEAVASGIKEVIIVTGRGKRAIEDHFDISFELEENLRENGKNAILKEIRKISMLADFCYVRQSKAKGLGHAILTTKNLVGNEPFAVLLGDDIVDAEVPALRQMVRIYEKYHAPVLAIAKVRKDEVKNYGIIKGKKIDRRLFSVEDLVEKPDPDDAPSDLAVIGRYILVPEVFGMLEMVKPGKNGEIQLTDGLRILAKKGPIYGYLVEGKRYDAGDKLGFLKATVEFALKNPDLGREFRSYLGSLVL
ncbi:MAG TPA: UTP--glucose-1-phosphate uridylyltransferase GalU [Nitrospiria bacterium]|nr:UTP--glucose-1-phosphate uridylyltransferase GalU [Nitrospiria bacterium]